MANTLGGINLAQIAQESLDFLGVAMAPTRAFTRDFSTDIRERGASVSTRIVSSVTAQDLSSSYTKSDVTSTAVTVTLDKFKGFSFGFHDTEVAKAGDSEWLKRVFMVPAINATVNAVMDDALTLVTNANYSTTETITAANFDADEVADLSADLSGANVPKTERAILLPATYFATIQKDATVQDASAYGNPNAVQEHMARRLHGFDLYEYTDIPTNSENLAAIALHPSAIAIAARQVPVPDDDGVMVENVVDNVTGLPLQFRAWYDRNGGNYRISVAVLYGVAVGNATALKRITSA